MVYAWYIYDICMVYITLPYLNLISTISELRAKKGQRYAGTRRKVLKPEAGEGKSKTRLPGDASNEEIRDKFTS